MGLFAPVDPALLERKSFVFKDAGLERLQYISERKPTTQLAHSWGYTIFRTWYASPASDDRFARALDRLDVYAKNWVREKMAAETSATLGSSRPPPDPRSYHEIEKRIYQMVIEDKDSLEGASIQEVGRYFDSWIARRSGPEGSKSQHDPLFRRCIMLDEESINNILTLPEVPAQSNYFSLLRVWAKVVTSEERDGLRLWLRVGVYGWLWDLWFEELNPDFIIEEHAGPFNHEGAIDLYGAPGDDQPRRGLLPDAPGRPPPPPAEEPWREPARPVPGPWQPPPPNEEPRRGLLPDAPGRPLPPLGEDSRRGLLPDAPGRPPPPWAEGPTRGLLPDAPGRPLPRLGEESSRGSESSGLGRLQQPSGEGPRTNLLPSLSLAQGWVLPPLSEEHRTILLPDASGNPSSPTGRGSGAPYR